MGLAHPDVGWVWEPSVLAGLVILQVSYLFGLRATGGLRGPHGGAGGLRPVAFFTLGTIVVAIALLSPLDPLGDDYLFSAHMAQHLLLLLLGPMLWVMGLPESLTAWALSTPRLRRLGALLTHPMSAAVIWSLAMWAWHWPPLYDRAVANEGLHIFEHVTFMAAGVIGWWPAFGPRAQGANARPGLVAALHLFIFSLSCTALAALLTLSPVVLYARYVSAPLAFGLTPLSDQQLGGLLMWLPGDMLIVGAAIGVLARWLSSDHDARRYPQTMAVEVN